MIPTAWPFTLLGLAAFRSWRLLAEDTILDRPRSRVPKRLDGLVECPWCLGAWIAVGWWAAWQAWPHGTLVVAVPFALSTLVGAVAMSLNRLAEDA